MFNVLATSMLLQGTWLICNWVRGGWGERDCKRDNLQILDRGWHKNAGISFQRYHLHRTFSHPLVHTCSMYSKVWPLLGHLAFTLRTAELYIVLCAGYSFGQGNCNRVLKQLSLVYSHWCTSNYSLIRYLFCCRLLKL